VLPKINRLTKKSDFDLVFKKGEGLKNNSLIFKILKNYLNKPRFGFVVSKKVSNKATVRNKVKRRLRKAVLDNLKNIKKSVDIVIITLPGIEKKEFLDIKNAISETFEKLKLI